MSIDERKFVVLTILTYLVCGAYSWLTQGLLVFPFPLNEYIFLGAALWMGARNFREDPIKWLVAVLTLSGLFGVLSTEFFWSFFIKTDDLIDGRMAMYTDSFNVLYYLGIVVAMILSVIRSDKRFAAFIAIPAIVLLIIGWIINNVWLGVSGIVIFGGWSFTQLKSRPLYYIWVLLAVLELFKWGSLVFR